MKSNFLKAKRTVSHYPFSAELAAGDGENEILLVDVGGGRGHIVEAIRESFPELKGRMIVQDLKETVEEIEDPKGFEPMAHDFFQPQPVKGK
jgi:O-methyltransferase domain